MTDVPPHASTLTPATLYAILNKVPKKLPSTNSNNKSINKKPNDTESQKSSINNHRNYKSTDDLTNKSQTTKLESVHGSNEMASKVNSKKDIDLNIADSQKQQ